MFYEDLFSLYKSALLNVPFASDLFLTTDTALKQRQLHNLFRGWRGRVEIAIVPNRGRDIAAKLIRFADVYSLYELVLHLHTKKQIREHGLEGWREHVLDRLLGSSQIVNDIVFAFEALPSLGIIAGSHFAPVERWVSWGENKPLAEQLAQRMKFSLANVDEIDFPAGSMFWARPEALRPLLELRLSFEEFPPEAGQRDGTLAHAIERLYYLVCEIAGYTWLNITTDADDMAFIPNNAEEMRRGLSRERRRLYRASLIQRRLRKVRLWAQNRYGRAAENRQLSNPKVRRVARGEIHELS